MMDNLILVNSKKRTTIVNIWPPNNLNEISYNNKLINKKCLKKLLNKNDTFFFISYLLN